ncbi:AraC family transcriptional regulator [Polaromonas sp.]|uniref:AraC family transcriptional regulator n=1 Tax=Polaromonas sp. TaxID=1869339 RepID=UPI003267A1AC
MQMDPLDELFSAMRVENALYARLEARAPWGLSTRRGDNTARFGLVLRGGGWLTLDGDATHPEPIALATGDCFIIPHGSPYTLRDDLSSATVNCVDVVRNNIGGLVQIGQAAGGACTTVVSGWFNFDPDGARPLLDLLPPLLHIRMDQERTQLLQSALQLLAMETVQRGLGSGLIVSRLADIIFVQVVRAHIEALDPETESGWLAALSDRRIGPALHLMHKDVASNWTVEALAAAVGMSRSAFALRFKHKVGQSPLDYLTRWRMFRAGHMLRHTSKPLVEVACSVGYESEAAFNKAFKRSTGAAPGAYRRNVQAPAS